MLSFNQQSVTGANPVNTSDNVCEQWPSTQPNWAANSTTSNINYQNQQWQQQQINLNLNALAQRQNWPSQPARNLQYQQNFYPSPYNAQNQFPVPQVQYRQRPLIHTASQQYSALQVQNPSTRRHQGRISLIPNTNGGFKAIVKRKRNRTKFTTEQVEVLESVFRSRPYVSREDRKVLVDQLQISDTPIKVWFQNRRLRGKREAAEQSEAELYEDYIEPAEESFYASDNTEAVSSDESLSGNYNAAQLDRIEKELNQKVDASGLITLDEKVIGELVFIIDKALSADVNLDTLRENSRETANETLNDVSNETSNIVPDDTVNNVAVDTPKETASDAEDDSEASTYAGSIYEPISPALSEKPDDNEDRETHRWKPFAPEESLQKLFDLHFC